MKTFQESRLHAWRLMCLTIFAVLFQTGPALGEDVDLFLDFPEEATRVNIGLVEKGEFNKAIEDMKALLADKSIKRSPEQVEDLRIGMSLVYLRCGLFTEASRQLPGARGQKDRPDRGRQVEVLKEIMRVREYAAPTTAEAIKAREQAKKDGKAWESALDSREEWRSALVKFRRDRDKDLKKRYDTIDLYVKDANFVDIPTQLEQSRVLLERAFAVRTSEDSLSDADFFQQHVDRIGAALSRLTGETVPSLRAKLAECQRKNIKGSQRMEIQRLNDCLRHSTAAERAMNTHLAEVRREFRR